LGKYEKWFEFRTIYWLKYDILVIDDAVKPRHGRYRKYVGELIYDFKS